MIKLEITGNDPKDFYVQCANALLLVVNGGERVFSAKPDTPPQQNTGSGSTDAVPVGDATKMPPADKPPRNRKPASIELKANKPAEMPEGGDAVPDMTNKPDVELTAEGMKQRVRDIIEAHTARGNDMPTCVAYVQKLFKPFNIEQAAKVPAARFAEFMAASEPYLDGTAK